MVNITAIENAQSQVAGWLYETENGSFFFQGNANMPSVIGAFGAFLSGFPQAFLAAIDTSQQVDASELQSISGAEQEGGFTPHDCFSSNLSVG